MTGLCLSRVNISFNISARKANEALSSPYQAGHVDTQVCESDKLYVASRVKYLLKVLETSILHVSIPNVLFIHAPLNGVSKPTSVLLIESISVLWCWMLKFVWAPWWCFPRWCSGWTTLTGTVILWPWESQEWMKKFRCPLWRTTSLFTWKVKINKYIKNKTFSRNTTYATFVRLSLHKSYFNIFFSKLTPTLLSGLSTLLTVNVPSAFTVKWLSSMLKRITVRSVQSVKPTGKG